MSQERLERTLEAVRSDIVAVRETLAAQGAQFEMWMLSDSRRHADLDEVCQKVAAHAEADAATHASLSSDVLRLWWGLGVVLTAVAGAAAAGVIL